MTGPSSWITGGFVGLAGLGGLFLAAGATDGGIYWFGLGLFVFAALFDFGLIKSAWDEADRRAAEHRAADADDAARAALKAAA